MSTDGQTDGDPTGSVVLEGDVAAAGDAVVVLLVDDDATWAETTAQLLEHRRERFDVRVETTLADARAALGPQFDCVVCDYDLRNGDGLELLATVRESDPEFPFVLVTGAGSEAVASEAISAGVSDYVRKEASRDVTETLVRRVENAVERHRTGRALERERASKDALLDVMSTASTRQGIERGVCEHLVGQDNVALAWIGEHHRTRGVAPRTAAGEEAYLEAVFGGTADADVDSEPAVAATTDEELRVVDRVTDADGAWARAGRECGFGSVAAVPLVHGSVLHGVLAVYDDRPAAFGPRRRGLLEEYGTAVGYALDTTRRTETLLADDTVETAVTVADDTVPLAAFVDALATTADDSPRRIQVPAATFRDEKTLLYVATVPEATPDAVREAAGQVPDILAVEHLGDRRYEFRVATPTPESLLAARGAQVDRTVVDGSAATVEMVTSRGQDVRELAAAVGESFDAVTVSHGWTTDAETDDPSVREAYRSVLTDKQRGALEVAYLNGYFERPREHDATEVADKLDVSRQTFAQHLRAAQRKLFGPLIEDDG